MTVHQGPYENVEPGYRRLFMKAYHSTEWLYREGPLVDEFLNQLGFNVQEKDSKTRLCLPIKRA